MTASSDCSRDMPRETLVDDPVTPDPVDRSNVVDVHAHGSIHARVQGSRHEIAGGASAMSPVMSWRNERFFPCASALPMATLKVASARRWR